ncbi:MAG TPA: glycosyltransferase family 39 protein [Candidatus Limnocylindrales bacterium]|nr:glycosyltransferase family 39 protein [Candidatus Limnocylindrales bacterium]
MPSPAPRHPFAAPVVLAIAAAVLLALLALAPAYGFHRDELYFIVAGQHPAWGYDDQPPLTPLLAAGAVALLGMEPWAVRILPAVAIASVVVLTALIARELGGTRRAQALAAVVIGTSGFLAAGHLGVTATYDLLAWAAVLWLVARILRGADPRLWLLVGVVGGIGLLNKHLPLFLVGGLAIALLVHRRELLRSPWPWAGAVIALALWAPNLAWQVANGLPQLEMARQIGGDGADERPMVVIELLLLAGPLLFPVTLVGLWRLLRDPSMAPFRALGTTFLAILAVVLLAGGKSYYVIGSVPPLMAAGAIAVDGWLGASRSRGAAFGAVTVASLAIVALLTLPVLPASTLAATPIPELYAENAETVGWPELVATVEGVVERLPPEARVRAAILTANYGEHGALTLLGRGLPPVYSGHNSTWSFGRPDDGRDLTILVGRWSPEYRLRWFGPCAAMATIGNDAAMANQEAGVQVLLCDGLRAPWSELWPELHHFD